MSYGGGRKDLNECPPEKPFFCDGNDHPSMQGYCIDEEDRSHCKTGFQTYKLVPNFERKKSKTMLANAKSKKAEAEAQKAAEAARKAELERIKREKEAEEARLAAEEAKKAKEDAARKAEEEKERAKKVKEEEERKAAEKKAKKEKEQQEIAQKIKDAEKAAEIERLKRIEDAKRAQADADAANAELEKIKKAKKEAEERERLAREARDKALKDAQSAAAGKKEAAEKEAERQRLAAIKAELDRKRAEDAEKDANKIISKLQKELEAAKAIIEKQNETIAKMGKEGPNKDKIKELIKEQLKNVSKETGINYSDADIEILEPTLSDKQRDEMDFNFKLIHPKLLKDPVVVGLQPVGSVGCQSIGLYQALKYPELELNESVTEFNTKLKEQVFRAAIIPHPEDKNVKISLIEYKNLLDQKIKDGLVNQGTCGTLDTVDNKCSLESEGGVYKYFTTPQMMMPLYINPLTIKENPGYPGILLYHAVGAGKTCTALKIFNNFRCEPYKKVWVTTDELVKQLTSGAAGKSELKSCWDGDKHFKNVFIPKEPTPSKRTKDTKIFKGGADEILVLNYKQFSDLLCRSAEGETSHMLYENRYSYFWKKPGSQDVLPASTYRYLFRRRVGDNKAEVDGERTLKWKQLNDFDPFENTIIIIDEAHKLDNPKAGMEMRVIKNALRDSRRNPKGAKIILMTATPITDNPMTAIKLLNMIMPTRYNLPGLGLPEDIDDFKNSEYWDKDKNMFNQKFINIVKGLISHYDPSSDLTQFAKKIPGKLLIQDNNLQYESKYNNNVGVVKILLSQDDQKNIKHACGVADLDFDALEKMSLSEIMSLPQVKKKETFDQLKMGFGVKKGATVDEFLKSGFVGVNPNKIKSLIIKKLKTRPLECMQDLSTSGSKAEYNNKSTQIAINMTKAKLLADQIIQLDQLSKEKHMIYSSIDINKSENQYIKGKYSTVPERLFQRLISNKQLNLVPLESTNDLLALIKKANLKINEKGKLCPISGAVSLEKPSNNTFFLKNTKGDEDPQEQAKKELFETIFNDHHYNNVGQLIRFVVLDTGYKEGLNLFDVRHVHIMEPQISQGDLTQAIGRAIRRCGHKGTKFEKGKGWEVLVYMYDTWIESGNTQYSLGDKIVEILAAENTFTYQLDNILQTAAIDYSLNANVSAINVEKIDPQTKLLGTLWQRPPESFNYIEDPYFYKMFPKVHAIPDAIKQKFNQKYNNLSYYKWLTGNFTSYADWVIKSYFTSFFQQSAEYSEKMKNEFLNNSIKIGKNEAFGDEYYLPENFNIRMFINFNYHEDIIFTSGNKVALPIFTFKERSKINYKQVPKLSDVRAMLIFDTSTNELSVFFRNLNGSICEIPSKKIDETNKDTDLYNLSLWLRIPEENINFAADISSLVGDCKSKITSSSTAPTTTITTPTTNIPPTIVDDSETADDENVEIVEDKAQNEIPSVVKAMQDQIKNELVKPASIPSTTSSTSDKESTNDLNEPQTTLKKGDKIKQYWSKEQVKSTGEKPGWYIATVDKVLGNNMYILQYKTDKTFLQDELNPNQFNPNKIKPRNGDWFKL